jgi:PAS domain S-box-containing protein
MSAEMPDNVSAEYDQLKVELANVRAELDFFRANCCKWWSTLNSEEPVPLLDWIVEKTPIVLWAIDQQGIFRLSVGKALESLGLKPGEVVGRSAFEVYSDHPQVIAMLHRVLSGDSFASEVVEHGHFFEVECVPVRNTDGTQIGAVGVSLEVTRRRSAESQAAELSHSHDQNLQAMIDAVPEKALMIDADFTVLFANQRFSDHTGIPLKQLLGANIHNLYSEWPGKG